MGEHVTQSASRIPLSVHSNAVSAQVNGDLQAVENDGGEGFGMNHTNGEFSHQKETQLHNESKGFETFLMTGEMIIRTSQKSRNPSSRNPSDSTDETTDNQSVHSQTSQSSLSTATMIKSNQISAESGFEDHDIMGHDKFSTDFSEGSPMSSSQSSALSSGVRSDISEQTVIHQHIGSEANSGTDSSSGVVSPETSNGDLTLYSDSQTQGSFDAGKIVTSKSAEKIVTSSHQAVRTSKSQEIQTSSEFSAVNIDIDDNYAHSLDQIPQGRNDSMALIPSTEHVSKSTENSPEHSKDDRNIEKEFIPGFINLNDPHLGNTKNRNDGAYDCDINYSSDQIIRAKPCVPSDKNSLESDVDSAHRSERDSFDPSIDPNLLEYQPPTKNVDQPSAHRLAKRLFNMDGFKKSDVARHLSKKNDFNSLVAEEYLKYFDFKGDTLDLALRKFLDHFSLIGETQERERVLAHFSKRYMDCNPATFNSDDACHTLTCAIMLLNTDLHGQSVGRKMTCAEFIENLAELNDGENFYKEILKSIYHAIKTEQLEWALDEDTEEEHQAEEEKLSPPPQPRIAVNNPYLDVPDPSQATEYKSGYIMRKCCKEPDSRKTPLGKRGWKMFYSSLKDMVLYLYKDQHSMRKGQLADGSQNTIRIHHCLASKASDYTKKQHVLRLQTADWAEYLVQTSDSKELQLWIDTINFVAASLSAPALPGAVGSQKKFQRPLLPASYTRFNLREQLERHDNRAQEIERDLQDHRQYPPEKGSKTRIIQDYIDKENYLEHELKRYKTYVYLLQAHMAAFPELEPSLVETVIGEVDESATETERKVAPSPQRGVQRSLSDRNSGSTESSSDSAYNARGYSRRRPVLCESSI